MATLEEDMELETTDEGLSAFDEGFDNPEPEFEAEAPENEVEDPVVPDEGNDVEEGEAEASPAETTTTEEQEDAESVEQPNSVITPEEPETPRMWSLDDGNGGQMNVNEAQLLEMAQFGMRSRGGMEILDQFAREADMPVDQYVNWLREQNYLAQGYTEDQARVQVKQDRWEAQQQAQRERIEREQAESMQREERIRADIMQFSMAFPEAAASPNGIPKEVWDSVNQGLSLTAAYARYAVNQANAAASQARQQAQTENQNTRNAARSTGSMRSAGEEIQSNDPFLDGWNS